jgi:hypothetical protein
VYAHTSSFLFATMRLLVLLLVVLLSGCASSSVQRTTDQGEQALRTRAIPLYDALPAFGSARTAQAPYQLSAVGRCVDDPCTSGGAFLVVRANGGVNTASVDYTPVSLTVDGQRFDWPEIDAQLVGDQQRTVSGEFLRLALTFDKLRSVAFGTDVVLNLGPSGFPLTYAERLPMRELIAELQGGVPAGSTSRQ